MFGAGVCLGRSAQICATLFPAWKDVRAIADSGRRRLLSHGQRRGNWWRRAQRIHVAPRRRFPLLHRGDDSSPRLLREKIPKASKDACRYCEVSVRGASGRQWLVLVDQTGGSPAIALYVSAIALVFRLSAMEGDQKDRLSLKREEGFDYRYDVLLSSPPAASISAPP